MQSTFKTDLLEGKVALVTGGRGGIMYGIVKSLLQHGCKIAMCSRNDGEMQKAVTQLKQDTQNQNCVGIQCDVRKFADVERAVDEVLKHYQKIDILINGAAGNFLASLDQLTPNGFKTVIEIDAIGTFHLIKAVYSKYMKEHGGNIINISATLHYNGTFMQSHAGSAKAAVDAMTKHFAVELGPKKIRVNGIAPGPIENTEGMKKLRGNSEKEQMKQVLPLQRLGTIDDIANFTLFLASEASSFMTGQTVVVDGGQILTAANFSLFFPGVIDAWSKGKL